MSENKKKDTNFIDPKEFDVAEQEARESTYVYVHKLSKPFTYEDKTYTEFTFEWEKLTGNDSIAIEDEVRALGKVVVSAEFSSEYLVRMAAKACTEAIGADLITALPLRDYNKIRGKARSFLMNAA